MCWDNASKLLRRVSFHYTPKHASWLNMAEIEIGILTRQCLDRRIANAHLLQREVNASSLAKALIKNSVGITFRNLSVDVLFDRLWR